MSRPDPKRLADRWLRKDASNGRSKTAGEVRFIKDRSGDKGEWAWGAQGPSERKMQQDFVFNAKHLKPLAKALRSINAAMGHAISAQHTFVRVKSANVSPDGSLGGKGYIQTIPDMRRHMMNCIEVLSSLSDTLYDEIQAPHWNPVKDELNPRDREEVKEIVEDAEEIKQNPEGWAKEEEAEMDEEHDLPRGKTAGLLGRVYVEQDLITGDWAVFISEGRRDVNVTDHIFRTERAAEREAAKIRAQVDAGLSADQIGRARRASNQDWMNLMEGPGGK